jgi:hypothetical protein
MICDTVDRIMPAICVAKPCRVATIIASTAVATEIKIGDEGSIRNFVYGRAVEH